MKRKTAVTDDVYLEIVENLCALNGKLEAIVESSTNGIAEIDLSGRIVAWNPSFIKLFRISHSEPESDFLFDYVPPGDSLSAESLPFIHSRQTIVLQDVLIDEFEFGDKKLFEVKLVPLNICPKIDFVVIIKDKSDVLTALQNREMFIKTLLDLIEDIKVDNRKTIYNLAKLVELRDSTTGEHLKRVEAFTHRLAREYFLAYGRRDRWVTEDYVEDIAVSSVLHDIGKVGISDTLLLKPDKLTPHEMEAMKQHTYIAGKALEKHQGRKDYLALGREIAMTHHERWNGKGYPRRLSGTAIPLSGRIVALCDTYDAVTHDRPYKKAQSHERAVEIIRAERGESFDPELVDLFLRICDDFRKINEAMP